MTSPRPREGTKRRRRLLARLIGLNMLGLIVLAGGFLVLSESRQFLTNAYKQSLEAQARIVAGALSQTVINRNFQFFDPSLFVLPVVDVAGARIFSIFEDLPTLSIA